MTFRLSIAVLVAAVMLSAAATFAVTRLTQPDVAGAAASPQSATILRYVRTIDKKIGFNFQPESLAGHVSDGFSNVGAEFNRVEADLTTICFKLGTVC